MSMADQPTLDELRQQNLTLFNSLAQRGVGLNLTAQLVDRLIPIVLPDEGERNAFLYEWECAVAEILAEVDRQIRMQQLTQGVHRPNGMG